MQPNAKSKFRQGYFKPVHPEKYEGDVTNIVYRSHWEFILMSRFDLHPGVISWSSESIIIRYPNPLTGRTSRYFPDFKMKKKNPDGSTSTFIIEVKPNKETTPPDRTKGLLKSGKPSKRYVKEAMTYAKNDAKWQAARAYCASRGYEFVIMDEYKLGIATRPSK